MDNRYIGVFDSGLGGLSAVKEIMEILPNENVIYFGDTGRVPYGTRAKDTILKYVQSDINFLLNFDIKAIVVACGTASAVAVPELKDKYDIPIIDVLSPTVKKAADMTKNGKICVLGTSGTINSGKFSSSLLEIDSKFEIVSKACPMFVPLVENGYINSEITSAIANEYLQEAKSVGVDTIILGCTHFPLISNTISDIMGEGVSLINPGKAVAEYLKDYLTNNNMLANTKAKYEFYVSDRPQGFAKLGSMFLNREITESIEQVDIEKF